jgi:phosphatidylglycerophosphate synthase
MTSSASPRVWIDASRPGSETRVFGLTLLERLLQGLRRAGIDWAEVCVERPDGAPADLRPELARALPLRWSDPGDAGFEKRVQLAVEAAQGEPLILVAADAVLDQRLLECFGRLAGSRVFHGPSAPQPAALVRLEGPLPAAAAACPDLPSLARSLVETGVAPALGPHEFDTYLVNLRRHLDPYLLPVPDAAALARVERFLFESNYKGSTDFLTRWVYPPLVWRMVRPLARWRVHPNWVTCLSIAATFAAVPLFALGDWVPGLLLAYLMSVLDSVDGKLARLTFTYSKLGNVLDHGLDIVHPPIWYMAWGLALGGGGTDSAPFVASLWLLATYALDRAFTGLFRWRTGVSVHGATPLDKRLRTFLSRRNPNLAFMTLALLADALLPGLGAAVVTFYAIVAWQVACFAWHALRLGQYWNTRLLPPPD